MNGFSRPKRSVRQRRYLTVAAIASVLVGYFIYHMLHGERGVFALGRLNSETHEAEAMLGKVRQQREQLEQKVSRMRDDNLDRDLLDEQVRKQLDYSGTDEFVVLNPNAAPASKAVKGR